MNTNDLSLAVLYLRMSTDKQDMSIADQRAKVLPWASGKYKIVEEYVDEGKSGSKDTDKRLSFLRMVKDLTLGKHAGKVRFIVSVDKSRFDRLDTLDGAEYKLALRTARISLDTPINGLIDWSTSMGRMMDTMLSEANHQTPLLIAEKGLQGRIRVTKEGRPNQTTPYGMAKKVKTTTGEVIVIKRQERFHTPKTWDSEFCPGEPAEVEAMRFAYQTFATEDLSYNELARKLDERKAPLPGGAPTWHGDTLTWMLSNPVYAGGLRIGETPKGKFFQTQGGKETTIGDVSGESEAVLQWGCHEGIIDRPLWDEVQAKIKRNFKTRRPPRNRGPYALSGILHCGTCGGLMYGSKNPAGDIIYRCHRPEMGQSQCKYWIAYEAEILPVLLGDFLQSVRQEIIRENASPEVVPINAETAKLRKELAALEAKLEQGREAVLDAPKKLRSGLLATLEKRERQRADLQEKIQQEAGQTKGSRLLAWWDNYQKEFFDSCPIDVGIPEPTLSDPEAVVNGGDPNPPFPGLYAVPQDDGAAVHVVKTRIPASVLREKLKRIDCRVFVWFKNKAKGRGYDLDKMRAKAYLNGEVCYEYASKADS